MECKWRWISMHISLRLLHSSSYCTLKFFFLHTHRYSVLRHPSYVGFYYWSVGTQLILCNPIACILYAIAAFTFFRYRIAYEEETLHQLFPDGAYESYAAKTYIGIPFIGFVLNFDNKKDKDQWTISSSIFVVNNCFVSGEYMKLLLLSL